MNKLRSITQAIACLALLAQPVAIPIASAQTATPPATSPCLPRGYYFDYFNGIKTTVDDAESNLHTITNTFGLYAPNGELVQYKLMYNHTTGFFTDVAETLDMRAAAQGPFQRYELFWEAAQGDGPLTRISKAVGNGTGEIYKWIESGVDELAVRGKSAFLANNLSFQQFDLAAQRAEIDTQAATGRKTVYFAHSQGNLYANLARDYVSTKLEENAIRVIHVAPASPTLRGPYTLADKDRVINALRPFGNVPEATNVIPGAWNPFDMDTFQGHSLQAIYLNPKLPMYFRIKDHVTDAFNVMTPDSRRAVAPFKLKLDWSGTKDLDFDIIEPSGTRVQSWNYIGRAGQIDPVSVTADTGPEIYSATCLPTQAHAGDFQINYVNRFAPEGTPASLTLELPGGATTKLTFLTGKPVKTVDIVPGTRLATLVYYQDPISGEYTAVLRP